MYPPNNIVSFLTLHIITLPCLLVNRFLKTFFAILIYRQAISRFLVFSYDLLVFSQFRNYNFFEYFFALFNILK